MSLTASLQDGLLTYLLHSTVLVGIAWIADRMLRRDALAARQALWRVALLGGVLTAGVQTGLGLEPVAGSWGFGARPDVHAAPPMVLTDLPAANADLRREALPHAVVRTIAPAASRAGLDWWLAVWLGGAAFVALGLSFAYRRFHASIRDRREITGGDAHALLRAVQRRGNVAFDVRLSEIDQLSVPIAFGLRRREICIPSRALRALTAEQQESLLAHELAHLVRHDPAWLLLDGAFSAIFFFQPLNWLVRRRLRTLSELACDSWAVETLGDPLALAGCLTEVAGWTRTGVRPVLAAAIGGHRSHLGHRVERLLDGSAAAADALGRPRVWAAAVALAVAVAWLAPGVSLADKSTPSDQDAPTAPVTTLDDQTPPEPPAAPEPPAPPKAPRQKVQRKVMPPVPAVPPAPAAPAEPKVRREVHRDVRILVKPDADGDDDVLLDQRQEDLEREIERHAEAIAQAAARVAERAIRNAQPQIDAVQRDVARTVQAALEKAQRDIEQAERAAREAEKGHRGSMDEASRQLEHERKRLDEERARLDEERARLAEEQAKLRAERDQLQREKGAK
jgi:beta-lactamase regulating signal transducer with metallopeptidase domain